LQKEIRRGKEVEALFWALELCPRYEAYMWRRLLVIIQEGIGVANAQLLQLVPELRRTYFEFRAWSRDGIGADGSNQHCRADVSESPKSRLGYELKTWLRDERERGLKLKVPDYALDKHTGEGKRKKRGFDH
jgi:replication-associated recombination protein RarA